MNRRYIVLSGFLVALYFQGSALATQIVSVKSNKVMLDAEASGEMLNGENWKHAEHMQTDIFSSESVRVYDQVYVDSDSNGFIDTYDEVINFYVNANVTNGSSATNAEIYWPDDIPYPDADPLPELKIGSLNVLAQVVVKSVFKVTGTSPVEFSGQVVNYEGNGNDSFGRLELWDLSTGDLVMEIDDRVDNDYYLSEDALLLTDHTYKLLTTSTNRTGGDEEIYVDYSFSDAMVELAEPGYPALFLLGLVSFGLIRAVTGLKTEAFASSKLKHC